MSTPSRPPVDVLFRQHVGEVAFWEQVAKNVERELRLIVQGVRVLAKVEARAKTTGSVIGKAYLKPDRYSELVAFPDLAGARVLLPFLDDADPVAEAVHAHPDLIVVNDETKRRAPDALEYQARHLDVQVVGDLLPTPPADFRDGPVQCEVQIQTLAQSLWANVSHQVTYKRDDLPADVRSRVNRLVVLCEIFDDEAAASRSATRESLDAVASIAAEVQRYYWALTGEYHDPEQALLLVARLLPAIPESERNDYGQVLEAFVQSHARELQQLLGADRGARGLHWLTRPEILLIVERITNRRFDLRRVWNSEFPVDELDAIESAWGH